MMIACNYTYQKISPTGGTCPYHCSPLVLYGVTLAQLVKASVDKADVQRFEPHLGHNLLSCGVFLVKPRHFGLLLAQTIRPNWQSLLAGGWVAIQTWSIYKVYT